MNPSSASSSVRAGASPGHASPACTSTEERWEAVRTRDAGAGSAFVYAVKTTGVVCRPACSSRTPRRENVVFFDTLADAEGAGFRPCKRCHGGVAATAPAIAIETACRLLDSEEEGVRASDVANAVGMTPASLSRAFRARLGITPGQYRQRVLAARAKAALPNSPTVTDAIYAAGYSASSRFYERTGRELGMAPRDARRGGAGQRVRFTARATSLGTLGVAWTERGVSDLFFVDDATEVETAVRARWPEAANASADLPPWLDSVVEAVERPMVSDVPLDIQGTAFQERVWQALRAIPYGQTRSYSEVADSIGSPGAQRAVAHAIGRNPIAVLVPCHRVVARDGSLAGYRWGTARKAELLRRERPSR